MQCRRSFIKGSQPACISHGMSKFISLSLQIKLNQNVVENRKMLTFSGQIKTSLDSPRLSAETRDSSPMLKATVLRASTIQWTLLVNTPLLPTACKQRRRLFLQESISYLVIVGKSWFLLGFYTYIQIYK